MTTLIAFLITVVCLVLIILIATWFINLPTSDLEKHSAYECGFEPFGDSRSFFDIHFYTIGLLFIIFDLEIVFLIPAVVDVANISLFGYINILIFLAIVLIGFYYEWMINLLNWLPSKVSAKKSSLAVSISVIIEVLSYSDAVFVALMVTFIASLIGGSYFTNPLYKVLNLVWLSLLIVFYFVLYVSFVFMPIAYILAYVGAVMMLFMSVVTMLPNSVKQKIKEKFFPLLSPQFASAIVSTNINFMPFGEISAQVFWALFYTIIFLNIAIILYLLNVYNIVNLGAISHKYYSYLASVIKDLQYKFLRIRSWPVTGNFLYKARSYFGFMYPLDVVRRMARSELNRSELAYQFGLLFAWHDFLYYLYINIEAPLYQPGHFYSGYVWGDRFKMFAEKSKIAQREGQVVFPSFDPLSFYVPEQTSWSLFKLVPFKLSVPKPLYTSKVLFCSTTYNRFIFISHAILLIFLNFVLSIIPLTYNALKSVANKAYQKFRYHYELDSPIEVIRKIISTREGANHLEKIAPLLVNWHDFLYYIYVNIEQPLVGNRKIAPVWGSLFYKFQLYTRRAKLPTMFFVPNVEMPSLYVPAHSRKSLFVYLPAIWHCSPNQYYVGNTSSILWLNRLISLKCHFSFFIINTLIAFGNFIRITSITIKLSTIIKQLILIISIFALSIPHGASHTSEFTNFIAFIKPTEESLSAVKQILYEYAPLFAIISVTGLLVALIGAAIMSRKGHKK